MMNLDWKRLLKFKHVQVFGLDIGSSAIKAVQMRKDETGWVVTAAGMTNISNGNGTEENKDGKKIEAVRAIRDCVHSASIKTQLAVCGICGPEVAVRQFKFPPLPTEEIHGAIMLEAAQVCPFNVDTSTVDFQLVPNSDDSISGVLVGATNKLIEEKSQFAKDASVDSVLMDVDGLALLNCFNECEKPDAGQTTAVLNVGSTYTTLAIMDDGTMPFVRDTVSAGNDIISKIAAEKNTSAEAVGKILFGADSKEQEQLDLSHSLASASQELITDITKTLRYYTAHKKSNVVEKLFVCGGFSLVPGFVELLNNRLQVAAVLWNPFEKLHCNAKGKSKDVLMKNGPAMAIAAGLAMRSI